jgi:hypothetical protein
VSNPAGKDGLDRNVSKLRQHWEMIKWQMKPYWEEFKLDINAHNWVDLFVESGRIPKGKNSNYFMGHVWAIYFPISLLLIIALTSGLVWSLL